MDQLVAQRRQPVDTPAETTKITSRRTRPLTQVLDDVRQFSLGGRRLEQRLKGMKIAGERFEPVKQRVVRITAAQVTDDLHKIIGRATNSARVLARLKLPEHGGDA